jgi:hypothetical protein
MVFIVDKGRGNMHKWIVLYRAMAWRLMSQRAWHYGVDIRVELPRIIPQGIAEYEYYPILKNEQCCSGTVGLAGVGMQAT